MPVQHIPEPRFDRRIYLLLLDGQDRLMLCGGCCNGWTVPRLALDNSAAYWGTATRFLADRFGIRHPRFGSVRGIHQSRNGDTWECDRTTVSHVLVVRVSTAESEAIEQRSTSHRMWTMDRLKARHRDISPAGVVLVATGYVDGWLPDGPISLD
ncbi:hypothetical protein ACFV4X_35010 [Streptomyces ardesiacus]|uniref:hypothetical protein n=1 Tax=Streptomyces ardesiacus TaxID=285564 RepID=UPI00366834F4